MSIEFRRPTEGDMAARIKPPRVKQPKPESKYEAVCKALAVGPIIIPLGEGDWIRPMQRLRSACWIRNLRVTIHHLAVSNELYMELKEPLP